MTRPFIVVGIDGSEASRVALRFACAEAQIRQAAVHAVHAWWFVPELEPRPPSRDDDWQTLRDEKAKQFVDEFVASTLGEARAGVEVTAVAVQGVTAAAALLDAAKGAELLVVGSRGHGGFEGLLLGSVSRQCLQHAACPVVIVRGPRASSKE
jgi:nucleotide-binding universal stress UspA family protein